MEEMCKLILICCLPCVKVILQILLLARKIFWNYCLIIGSKFGIKFLCLACLVFMGSSIHLRMTAQCNLTSRNSLKRVNSHKLIDIQTWKGVNIFNWVERNGMRKFILRKWLNQFWISVIATEYVCTYVVIQQSVEIDNVIFRKETG